MRPGIKLMMTATAALAVNNPFVQMASYASLVPETGGTITWPQTPTNGNLLFIFIFGDADFDDPPGYTKAIEDPLGPFLGCYRKIASGESTSLPLTWNSGMDVVLVFEFAGGYSGTLDDSGSQTWPASSLAEIIGTAFSTHTNDLIFAVAGFADGGITTVGTRSYNSGFTEIGYKQSIASGASPNNLEISVGFLKGPTATGYSSTLTIQHAANVDNPALIMAFS